MWATPPDSHITYTLLAANAGKPVYVEKPMARTRLECEEMIQACEEAGVPLFVAYYRRCLPKFMKIKELLDAEVIGTVRSVSIRLLQTSRAPNFQEVHTPWRVLPEISGGGYFVDLGSHQLDLLDYFFGPIEKVGGCAANQAGLYPAEDIVSASFRFREGIVGNGLWCFTVSESNQQDRTEIIGTLGTISYSTFDNEPIRLTTNEGTQELQLTMPDNVQLPLIESVVGELRGSATCPSTGITAARTNAAMDRILGMSSSHRK